MDRLEYVLAALSPARNASYTPVQVQKMFFLLDREASHLLEGPHYQFMPYDYGPFDSTVYEDLRILSQEGMVDLLHNGRWTSYRLTDKGLERANAVFGSLPPEAQDYVRKVSEYVRRLSFSELVRSIYKAYPEMKANSVFRDN